MIRIIVEHFQKHGCYAESNLEQRFLRSREKSELQSKRQGPKLYSKVHLLVISLKRQWLGEHEFLQP
jgi:hypothetical protein